MSQGKLTLSLVFAVVPSLFAAACVESEAGLDDEDVGTEAAAKLGCPHWGCDSNSPVIEIWGFHELNERGLPNEEGFIVNGMFKGSHEYAVHVEDAKLYGIPTASNVPVLQGPDLKGAFISVTAPDGNKYQIEVRAVSNIVEYWIDPDKPNETYELSYTGPGVDRPLCKNPPGRVDGEGRLWTRQYEAVIFTGDRYKAKDFSVADIDPRSTEGWFNIGCAGSALAKLHLNRHTTAGSNGSYFAKWEARQSMLKMYAGDICGVGVSSTRQGEPLRWTNTEGWQKLGQVASYEAIWGPAGAVCLDEHRLENSPLWVSLNVQAELLAACNNTLPPPCNQVPGASIVWPADTFILSANP